MGLHVHFFIIYLCCINALTPGQLNKRDWETRKIEPVFANPGDPFLAEESGIQDEAFRKECGAQPPIIKSFD